jgi:YgiT-type zinc finger domain-containing protein
MKNCPLCKGSSTNGTTTVTVELGFGVVVVRQVPATVCSQCGEEWLDDATSQKVEEIVNAARQKHVAVEIAEWSHVAA